jgi:hypothetical protein
MAAAHGYKGISCTLTSNWEAYCYTDCGGSRKKMSFGQAHSTADIAAHNYDM